MKKYDFQTLMEDELWYSLNWARVIDYLERFIVFSDPKDEKGFWTEVYGVILKIDHAPENLRQQAEEWLVVHGVRLE